MLNFEFLMRELVSFLGTATFRNANQWHFPLKAIKEIVIGPCTNVKLVKESIEFFCKNLALDINVRCSEILYRNM